MMEMSFSERAQCAPWFQECPIRTGFQGCTARVPAANVTDLAAHDDWKQMGPMALEKGPFPSWMCGPGDQNGEALS